VQTDDWRKERKIVKALVVMVRTKNEKRHAGSLQYGMKKPFTWLKRHAGKYSDSCWLYTEGKKEQGREGGELSRGGRILQRVQSGIAQGENYEGNKTLELIDTEFED